jgi:hypothetical protein
VTARGFFTNGRTGETVWFKQGDSPEVSLKRLAAAGADPDMLAALGASRGVVKSAGNPTLEEELESLHGIVLALVEALEEGLPLDDVDKARVRFLAEECAKEHARLVPLVKLAEKKPSWTSRGLGLFRG